MSLCMSERMTGYVTVCSMQSFTVSDPAGKMQISDKTMRHTDASVSALLHYIFSEILIGNIDDQ